MNKRSRIEGMGNKTKKYRVPINIISLSRLGGRRRGRRMLKMNSNLVKHNENLWAKNYVLLEHAEDAGGSRRGKEVRK